MKRFFSIAALLLLAAAAISAGIFFKRYLSIDVCLDRGGAWNYELEVCEGADR